MSLTRIDRIEFDTDTGEKAIELLYGDITLLPVEQKADLLMLSAFHGDYTPTPTSLIGALRRRFGVDVGALSRDKEEDLRRLFHCWWSKPLEKSLPYERILCFESSRSGLNPQKSVQAVFKALVPATSLFTNGVIISPLLSTGDQGYSEEDMMTAIVNAAVIWMKNGLNVKLFKLAIYRGSDSILEAFKLLKRKHNRLPGSQMRFKRISKPVPKFDFFLSYVDGDKENAEKVKQIFSQHQQELKFYSSEELAANNNSQDEEVVFNVLKTCSRVITFLSPAYLEDDDRVEEYNAAWCLNRQNSSFTRLAPMLCEAISNLPTYMSLIQWVDIRLRSDNTEKMIRNITLYVVGYVQEAEDGGDSTLVKPSSIKVRPKKPESSTVVSKVDEKYEYDVFISYAHANEELCKLAVAILKKYVPGVRLFVDRQELHTGGSWQQKLYHAVESSHMTIALLSQAYFNSKMCNEEFRLSLARHFTDKDYHLIPLQIEQLSDVEDRYLSVPNSMVGEQDIRSYVEHLLAPAVKDYLSDGKADGSFIPLSKMEYNLKALLEDGRCARLVDMIKEEEAFSSYTTQRSVFIMCSKDVLDSDIAFRIKMKLMKEFGFEVELNIESKDTATVLKKLDDADMIVVLVSSKFLEDDDLIEGLQVAINRQRFDKKMKLYPALLASSLATNKKAYHIYCELLIYELCLTDPVWESMALDEAMENHPNYKGMMKEWSRMQIDFDKKYDKWILEGSHESEVRLGRLEKNTAQRQLKFTTAVCNRVAYHVNWPESAENQEVLLDVFSIIKEIVLNAESTEKEKQKAIDKIEESYNSPEKSAGDTQQPSSSNGKENIDRLKAKHGRKSSQTCTVL